MMNTRSALFTTFMLALITSAAHAAQTTAPELTTEQKDTVTTRLNNHMAAVGGTSVAALLAGLILKNDVLRGIGIGGSLGTACYALQNDKNWVLVWLASGLARLGLTSKLQLTKPESIVLTEKDLKQIERSVDWSIKFTEMIDPEMAKTLNRDVLIEQNKPALRKAKAQQPILLSSQIASWGAYLWLRYIARQAEQEVRAGA